ncbi:hypothetical protein [Sulfurisphaera ohwakuensis]|uniref:Uncharacterized protein n=1 Tax=Sulfurisphaera ohwakuensis TaxID=69656 RepID=A0A650CF81_SULOH|nr:hypothetical protein [Sulfurisphaera ohwakuensis]MBB5254745.1 hypothetical protein [Sulfurisphaera ohwakuensis]QGR16418.1 hypothetical protein D1869_03770 [Sulfurisphaera ohwakuensis]
MECEKDVLEILDILFNSGLIRGRKVFEDDIKHLISHKKDSKCSENEILELTRRYLRVLGISVIKGSYFKEKPIKVFDDGSYVVETIYGVEYDILNDDSLIGRIIFYEDRTVLDFEREKKEYKINKATAIRVLKEYLNKYSYLNDFIANYIKFMEDNNDDKILQWLKNFLSTKS